MLTKRRHIIELDGLRGLAVLLVMVFHSMYVPRISKNPIDICMASIYKMGWCGVDVFFVLSGFLITSILLNAKNDSNYFSGFYYKRLLRIFPLYYLYLFVIFYIFFPGIEHKMAGADKVKLELAQHSQLWFWLYISNIKQFMLGANFFGAGVGHLWSLAIEEQFYMFWPVLVFVCSLKNLKRLSIFLILFSLVLRFVFYLEKVEPEAIYVFTFTRFDTLAFGGLVAILLKQGYVFDQKKAHRLLVLLLVLCGIEFVFFGPRNSESPIMYTIGFSIIGLTAATLISILQSEEQSFAHKIFKQKWLTFFGKYSYALYLLHPLIRQGIYRVFHQPKLFFGLQIFWDFFVIALVIICSTIAALISWHCYEKWFLKLKDRYHQKHVKETNATA